MRNSFIRTWWGIWECTVYAEKKHIKDLRRDRSGCFYVKIREEKYKELQEAFGFGNKALLGSLCVGVGGWVWGGVHQPTYKISNCKKGPNCITRYWHVHEWGSKKVNDVDNHGAWPWNPSRFVKIWVSREVFSPIEAEGHFMRFRFQLLQVVK